MIAAQYHGRCYRRRRWLGHGFGLYAVDTNGFSGGIKTN